MQVQTPMPLQEGTNTQQKCGYGTIELGTARNECMCVRVCECLGATEWKGVKQFKARTKSPELGVTQENPEWQSK